ncbi:MAG: N-6 DNA methylase [Elusimicrobiota bacterium]
MKSKIEYKKSITISPFDISTYKTERTGVAILMHWMREIIEEKNLDLGLPDVETSADDKKMPDAVIYESRKSQNVLCVIEAKKPYFDVFDEKELKKPAWEKANKRKARYFALTNFQKLIWFNTEKVNAQKPEKEQVIEKYNLSEIENLDNIEEPRYSNSIKKELEKFLTKLYYVSTGKEPEPKIAVDEWLIYRLQEKITRLSCYYRTIIEDKCHKDIDFSKKLQKWFIEQSWSFAWQPADFDKVARQTAYLLVNKILFYDLLQAKRPEEIPPLNIPPGFVRGSHLQKVLQTYFEEVLRIDYQTIYKTDFIDEVAFPDSKEVIKEIDILIAILRQYDFSKIGYDIIGRIFERLIPPTERHNLGQYFTSPDVVDLILKFCLKHETDKVFDPSCGTGTFLVRAYKHKQMMNQQLTHQDILNSLYGTDIAKFPAHLATINLAINDLSTNENYPQIFNEDFFALSPFGTNSLKYQNNSDFIVKENARSKYVVSFGDKKIVIEYPRSVDCIVGNPPYTRQEEISEIVSGDEKYKEDLIEKSQYDGSVKMADISKRAGIHAYFFVHGTKFLKDGGKFGFIVSNSWLDVDYGKGLQEFFLKNYKIITIIESKTERWFEEADVNTCIVILEKCKDEKERNENIVRFVCLKKPLRYFVPPAQDIWEKQLNRLNSIDKLLKTIFAHSEFYQNDDLRIFPKKQSELWQEGFDVKQNQYVGAKWGKYLRAPEIFFKILEKGKDKFVLLKELADVRFGIKTGANEFFYLTEDEIKEKGIEKEFWMHKDKKGKWIPNYVIKSPRECKSIVVNPKDLKYRVLMIHKNKNALKGTNILKYIEKGEEKGFHERPTCASRNKWYELDEFNPQIIWWVNIGERFACFENKSKCFVDKMFYGIFPKDKKLSKTFLALLNSTLQLLIIENTGQELTGALTFLTHDVWMVEILPFLNPLKINKQHINAILNSFRNIAKRPAGFLYQELGANSPSEVLLDKIKSDRRELDKIVMGEILGLSDEEQLEVYRAVVDLVKSRIEKAKSFGKPQKTIGGIDINLLVKTVMVKIGENTLGKFYREKILSQKSLYTKKLPEKSDEIKIEKELFDWRLYSGKKHVKCSSEIEAKYLKVWIESGFDTIKIPQNINYLKKILPELLTLKKNIDKIVDEYLSSIIDIKTRVQVSHQLLKEITK